MRFSHNALEVMRAWALVVPASQAASVAGLRRFREIEVAEDGPLFWLRGRSADAATASALQALPATARYEWDDVDLLRPCGALLPVRRLPNVSWHAIRQWAQLALPIANVPATLPAPVRLRLISAHDAVPANALLVPLAPFLDWAEQAPMVRLAPLRFAASTTGRALVLGIPLPPISGRACVETNGIVLPAGLTLSPHVPPSVVRRVVNAPDDAIVWWDEVGPRILSSESFIPVRRSTARLTRQSSAPA